MVSTQYTAPQGDPALVEEVLIASHISKHYLLDKQKIDVLKDISFTVARGEFVVITGSSGSGKTTLLSVLSGLEKPSTGQISLDGKEITEYSEDQLAPVRNELTGFVFQHFHLLPSLTALENVMFPAELRGDRDSFAKAVRLLERVGLSHRQNNYPTQMSGGEQQRIAICRALINQPKILFADEPTGNLDSENSRGILELMLEIHEKDNTSLVIATHSNTVAASADRVITLHDGAIVEGSNH